MNYRVGTPNYNPELKFIDNPDKNTNTNGIKLLNWLKEKYHIRIVNGCMVDGKVFDSELSFFRGNVCSQNYLVLSNSLDIIYSFSIMEKNIYSDHCPISTIITVKHSSSLNLNRSCADGLVNDNHWDINKRRIPSLVFSKIDWICVVPCLEDLSRHISNSIQNNSLNNDQIDALHNLPNL